MVGEPTRRVMLAAAAAGALGLTGCKGIAALGPVPVLPPDVVTLSHAIEAEQLMVASYAAMADAFTAGKASDRVVQVVAEIHAEHRAHLRQLRSWLVLPPGFAKSRLGGARRHAPSMAGGEAVALGALAGLERAAATRLTGQLLHVPPALAQLMASIAASEAAHVVFLRRTGSA